MAHWAMFPLHSHLKILYCLLDMEDIPPVLDVCTKGRAIGADWSGGCWGQLFSELQA